MSKHKRDPLQLPDFLRRYEWPVENPNYPQALPFKTPLVVVDGQPVRYVECIVEDRLMVLTRENRKLRVQMVKDARRERIERCREEQNEILKAFKLARKKGGPRVLSSDARTRIDELNDIINWLTFA